MREVGLLVATGSVLWGASGLAGRFRLGRRVDVVLATATLATLQVVLTVLFAGLVVRNLSAWTLLGTTIAVSAPVAWFTRDDVHPVRRLHALGRVGGRLPTVIRCHPWSSVLAIGALGELVWRSVISYAVAPYGWDALWYHLTTVATWVTAGRITFVPFGLWSNIFPANAEVLTTWVAAFTHTSAGLTGMQLPFGVLGAVAVMSLARTVGVSRSGAVAAGSMFALTPVVLAQTTSNYVDLTATALVLTSLAFGLRFVAVGGTDVRLRWRLALLCGIAGGLAIGTKTTSAAYVAVLGVVLVVGEVVARRRQARPGLRMLWAFAIPVVVLGGFWYVRIWAKYGSPVYPFAVNIGSINVFDGPAKASQYMTHPPPQLGGSAIVQPLRSWWHDVVSWLHGPDQYSYDQRMGGFGAVWLLLEVPLCAGLTWVAARRRDALYLVLVSVPVVGFVVQPYHWWTRFSMALIAPGVIAVAICVERVRPRFARRGLILASIVLIAVPAGLASSRLPTLTGKTFGVKDIVHRALHRDLGSRDGLDTAGAEPWQRWLANVGHDQTIAVERHPYAEEFYFPLFGARLSGKLIPIDPAGPGALISDLRAVGASVLAPVPGSNVDNWAAADQRHFHLIPGSLPPAQTLATRLGRAYRFQP